MNKNLLMGEDTSSRIDSLCDWIEQNHAQPIGWEDLTRQSGFTHKELISLFQAYKKTTPMWFIRQARESRQMTHNASLVDALPAHLLKVKAKNS